MADLIDELSGLDDAALAQKLVFDDKVKSFKDDLAKAAKLTGDARAKVVKHLDRMFTPDTWEIQDLGHTVKRAEKSGTTPSDIAGCCCGMPGDYD
jgi:hypothetical protein